MKKSIATKISGKRNQLVMILTIAAFAAIALVEQLNFRVIFVSVAVLAVVVWQIVLHIKNKGNFLQSVMAHLQEVGLQCKEQDGIMLVKQGDMVLKARLWNRPEKGSKRVHFMFDFTPGEMTNVKPEGWALLATECNMHYDYTTLQYCGDHLCCQVETTVKSAKDFVREYRFAVEKISETLASVETSMPNVMAQFRPKPNRIGFVIGNVPSDGEVPVVM